MKKPPLVEVRWLDAVHRDTAVSIEDAATDDLAERVTVGFLIAQNERKTVIAMTYDPPAKGMNLEVDGRFTIPTGWIHDIRFIERGPRGKRAESVRAKQAPTA